MNWVAIISTRCTSTYLEAFYHLCLSNFCMSASRNHYEVAVSAGSFETSCERSEKWIWFFFCVTVVFLMAVFCVQGVCVCRSCSVFRVSQQHFKGWHWDSRNVPEPTYHDAMGCAAQPPGGTGGGLSWTLSQWCTAGQWHGLEKLKFWSLASLVLKLQELLFIRCSFEYFKVTKTNRLQF